VRGLRRRGVAARSDLYCRPPGMRHKERCRRVPGVAPASRRRDRRRRIRTERTTPDRHRNGATRRRKSVMIRACALLRPRRRVPRSCGETAPVHGSTPCRGRRAVRPRARRTRIRSTPRRGRGIELGADVVRRHDHQRAHRDPPKTPARPQAAAWKLRRSVPRVWARTLACVRGCAAACSRRADGGHRRAPSILARLADRGRVGHPRDRSRVPALSGLARRSAEMGSGVRPPGRGRSGLLSVN
jgi:hypothetical protein